MDRIQNRRDIGKNKQLFTQILIPGRVAFKTSDFEFITGVEIKVFILLVG
jgi:hypothetical protein